MSKCSDVLRLLKRNGWYIERPGKGSHLILKHPIKMGVLILPNHGSDEMAKGTEKRILKDAGLL